jgi:phosphoglycolate phosphatase
MHDAIIFDLDGTLWNVNPTVAVARNNVVEKLKLPVPVCTVEDVEKTVGLPVDQVYRVSYPMLSQEVRDEFMGEVATELALQIKKMGAVLYPGVADGIKRLSERYSLYIVSNCGSGYIESFLDWSGLTEFFKDIECYGNTLKPKSENIRSVVQRNRLAKPLYVGDTRGDHEAAIQAGVNYIHVTYGFGQPAGPCQRVASFAELEAQL